MLIGKNVVLIKGENKTYRAVVYDRIYLEFAASDQTEEYTKQTDKKDVLLSDGSVFKGVRPAESFSKADDQLLMTEALNQCVADISTVPDWAGQSPYKVLLGYASYGRDLKMSNSKIRAEENKNAPEDPAVSKAKLIKAMVANRISSMAAKGKTVTAEVATVWAEKEYARMQAEDAEEAAA
jgi:hypothetical protein